MSGGSPPVSNGVISVPFTGVMAPVLMTADGKEHRAPRISLDELVATAPFRSVIAMRWPTEIAFVWPLIEPDPLPLPQAAMENIAEVLQAGRGVLILSGDRERRDRVKAALLALFGPGASV